MEEWHPIEEARHDEGDWLLLARFQPNRSQPDWVIQAQWTVNLPYTGWRVCELPTKATPKASRTNLLYGYLPNAETNRPTHWSRISKLGKLRE